MYHFKSVKVEKERRYIMENLSAADVAAVTRPNYMGMGMCGGMGYGMGGLEGLIGLAAVALIFGGGWGGGFGGGFGGGGNGVAAIYGAQQFTQLDNGIRAVQNGICDSTFALNNSVKDGFYSVNSNISSALCNTTYELASKIDANRFAAQQCCCETQRAIDSVKYGASQNTCDIITAIHAEGEATRAQMTQNTIQALRDKLNDKDRDIQTRDFQLSQLAQNSYLVNTLNPAPIPAYTVQNPKCCYNPCGCACGAYAD